MMPLKKRSHATSFRFLLSLLFVAVMAFLVQTPMAAEAAVYVVNDLGDYDDGVCDTYTCTLREAIHAANANPGPDTIVIEIGSGSPNWTIWLDSELPALTDDDTTIDATTMPEFLGGPSVVLVGDDDIDHAFLVQSSGNTIRGFKFSSFRGDREGAPIVLEGGGNLVQGNVLPCSSNGLIVRSDDNRILENWIGVMPFGSPSPNDHHGILLEGSRNLLEGNIIAHNGGEGILVEGEGYLSRNTFRRNSIFDNHGLGIEIGDHNDDMDPPTLEAVDLDEVSGQACRGCTVEIFLAAPDPTEYGEGQTWIAEAVADDARSFSIPLETALEECDPVTATATDASGNTSSFALNQPAGLCMRYEMPPLYEPYLTVNTTDDLDDGVCTEEHCSLREAINYANGHIGEDTIQFAILGAAPHTIRPEPRLPALTNDRTFIDGASNPDYDGAPVIWIENGGDVGLGLWVQSNRNRIRAIGFSGFGEADDSLGWTEITGAGLDLEGGHNRVEGCVFTSNGRGIVVESNHNTLLGNIVGAGGGARGNLGSGIVIGGDDNQIGGSASGEGNLVSGNGRHGINIYRSEGNIILGNIIGGDASGDGSVPNEMDGIFSQGSVVIGGLETGAGNLIRGNGRHGINFYDTSNHTLVQGNTIHDNEGSGLYRDSLAFDVHTFSQNSLFANGALGINTNRVGDHVPDLESASLTELEGSACSGCLVEIFLAEADPSGSGEGKTYLGEVRADIAGQFRFDLDGLERCDELTATATDGDGETSAFAENVLVGCFRLPGPPMAAGGLLFLGLLLGVLLLVRAVWPAAPGWFIPGVAGAGLIVMLLVVAVVLLLPSFEMDWDGGSRDAAGDSQPLPTCIQLLNMHGFEPADDVVLGLDEDPAINWVFDAELPHAEFIWRVVLRDPDQTLYAYTTTLSGPRLSDFGSIPRPGGIYAWTLEGGAFDEDGDTWLPACKPDAWRSFSFENPLLDAAIAAAQAGQSEAPTETEEEETCLPSVTASEEVDCLQGPDASFAAMGVLAEGESAEIEGRTEDSAWWLIILPGTGKTCWVSAEEVETACGAESAPVVEGASTPVPPTEVSPTPVTPTPVTPSPVPPTDTPVPDTSGPPAPNTLAPKNGQDIGCVGSITLSWSAVSDPSGISQYVVQVERSQDESKWVSAPGSPFTAKVTSLSISVECGWYYRWRVRAVDGADNEGTFSGWSSFMSPLQ